MFDGGAGLCLAVIGAGRFVRHRVASTCVRCVERSVSIASAARSLQAGDLPGEPDVHPGGSGGAGRDCLLQAWGWVGRGVRVSEWG